MFADPAAWCLPIGRPQLDAVPCLAAGVRRPVDPRCSTRRRGRARSRRWRTARWRPMAWPMVTALLASGRVHGGAPSAPAVGQHRPVVRRGRCRGPGARRRRPPGATRRRGTGSRPDRTLESVVRGRRPAAVRRLLGGHGVAGHGQAARRHRAGVDGQVSDGRHPVAAGRPAPRCARRRCGWRRRSLVSCEADPGRDRAPRPRRVLPGGHDAPARPPGASSTPAPTSSRCATRQWAASPRGVRS